jgi:hypothetical protein
MKNKNEKLELTDVAMFSWNYGDEFFLETDKGNFVWSDPDYQGDNTIRPFEGNHSDWLNENGLEFSRDKGQHTIEGYCGKDVKII